jgi:diguanylate cyclase (GGDEF)-like protein
MKLLAKKATAEKIQRMVILIAFPIGSALVTVNAWIFFQMEKPQVGWLTMILSGLTMVLWGILFFKREYLHFIETTFYYAITTFLCLLIVMGINDPEFFALGGRFFITSAAYASGFWYAIVYLAAYLSLARRTTMIFMIISLLALFSAATYHILFWDGIHLEFIIDWVSVFFGIFVVVLTINQTGQLKRDYAEKDDLTSVLNRRELYNVINREIERANRYQKPFSVVMIDIDHFKYINDNYGHLVGDRVLAAFAEMMTTSIRGVDIFGRWGGEEFLAVLPETGLAEAQHLSKRLCALVQQSTFEAVPQVTASFGVTTYQAGQTLEESIHAADQALYQAKQNGRNQVVVYTAEDSPDTV